MTADAPAYQIGFGNEFATEALAGALPIGQSNPQKPALGLYTEEINGTPFTAPRGPNRRTWTYRISPSAMHKPFQADPARALIRSGAVRRGSATPNQLRWRPLPIPDSADRFRQGIVT